MERISFAVKEKIESTRLNVLNVGVIARGGKFLVPGADRGPAWGDILLTAPALRNMAPARALTYVEVTTLTREALEETCADYPASAVEVRQAAMRMALIKATDLISTAINRKRQKKRRASLSARQLQKEDRVAALAAGFRGDSDHFDSPLRYPT